MTIEGLSYTTEYIIKFITSGSVLMLQRIGCRLKDSIKPQHCYKLRQHVTLNQRCYSQYPDKQRLRILFCGSDDFSIASLHALHQYSHEKDSNVESIDVAAKTDKRVGRGMKTIRPPPIKLVAQSLDLPIHQFDTFRGWNLPTATDGSNHINLIVAVSFGLLVPPRILSSCRYGGLNVHPSMLPDLKGSSPIEHAIINGYRKTGVTIQTLHPSKFDEGQIVIQTSDPGLDIPGPDSITSLELRDFLAPIGAKMLVDCIRNQRYLHPNPAPKANHDSENFNHAPKLSPESRRVVFSSMSLTHILRLNRALGRLWVKVPAHGEQADTRFICGEDVGEAEASQLEKFPKGFLKGLPAGLPFNIIAAGQKPEESKLPLLVKTNDSRVLSLSKITISGMETRFALAAAAKAGMIEPGGNSGQGQIMIFNRALG